MQKVYQVQLEYWRDEWEPSVVIGLFGSREIAQEWIDSQERSDLERWIVTEYTVHWCTCSVGW